ncbi:N-terminal binuclear Zn cluster-containing/DNA binding domain-containing protein [Trichoderma citrinoviride]|uniref:N-terminal binuclear Zn cluster-containing/DNA binding domain-containing protein n=1 Tax=Trichoderma citrinoviride TaxID=58853 RepID=A0A2T4B229_9HYPO|nr:N-terminal binuclear Zn cluster-containing/DNA binding domain-containing protein [Trichoderma citrinoviride]PTB63383.1 N-terminal binuclear Zn cluster-containing/DNA binding domain-containing protein [Trichoderma citrinoviride]
MSTPHKSPSPKPQAMTDKSNPDALALRWSCSACRQSKRRCDKVYPECTLCTQKNIPCNYPGRRKRQKLKARIKAASTASKPTVNPPSTSTTKKDRGDAHQLSFPSANTSSIAERFLDPDVFARAQLTVVNADVPVTDDIAQLVGGVLDIQATSAQFFKSVHTWMPIISKPQFCANLLNRLTYKRAELFLLVLSMKLCCARRTTPLYETVKLLHFKIETSGVLSVLVLQAAILIALYELGHSIYPAAYLSVGSCARYATALGIDKSILLSSLGKTQWIEEEECRRIWWAILVLDRYLNLSDPKRHLITPDADIDSYLPVDDEAWETGVYDPNHIYTLATANSYHLGLFARFAQAAHLLTKVLHHASEPPSETAQLRRTIFALVNVSKIEASMRRLEYCSQTSICYSGILLLESSSIDKDENHSGTQLSTESAHISQVTLDMALSFTKGDVEEICAIVSPFLVHILYRVASIHLRIAHESPTDAALEKVALLKKAMKIVGSRWLCASTYLSLLEKQEILLVMQ